MLKKIFFISASVALLPNIGALSQSTSTTNAEIISEVNAESKILDQAATYFEKLDITTINSRENLLVENDEDISDLVKEYLADEANGGGAQNNIEEQFFGDEVLQNSRGSKKFFHRCLKPDESKDVNVFVSEDFYAKNADIGGRVLVGEDASIRHYAIGKDRFYGKQLSCPQISKLFSKKDNKCERPHNKKGLSGREDSEHSYTDEYEEEYYAKEDYSTDRSSKHRRLTEKEFALIVNRKLDISDSKVFNGGVAYGSKDSDIRIDRNDIGFKCSVEREKNLVDFRDFRRSSKFQSFLLSRYEATSETSFFNGILVLKFNGKVKTEVFEISSFILSQTRTIVTEGWINHKTPIVINIRGGIVGIFETCMDSLARFDNRIIWNFPRTQFAFLVFTSIRGTVLAPWTQM